jgi:phosphatidylglycerophosphatase A
MFHADDGYFFHGQNTLTPAPPTSTAWYHRALLRIGSIGPFGHLPASGTVTVAFFSFPAFYALSHLAPVVKIASILLFTAVAMAIHHVGDRILGESDSRKLVWDELAGYFVAVAFLPFTWQLCVAAVILERILDILKAPPAGWIDRKWHNGVAVVADDLIAGAYTYFLLLLAIRLAPTWLGLPPALE